MIGDITTDTINLIYKESKKQKNQQKILYMMNKISSMAMQYISPYLYTIIAILLIMFVMNCFQFYYYLRYYKLR